MSIFDNVLNATRGYRVRNHFLDKDVLPPPTPTCLRQSFGLFRGRGELFAALKIIFAYSAYPAKAGLRKLLRDFLVSPRLLHRLARLFHSLGCDRTRVQMNPVFGAPIIHRENLTLNFILFCVFLTVNNHDEKAFSSSIIHVEKASPEKMFRLRRVINLPR